MTTALNHVVTAQTTVATEAGHVDQRVHHVNQSLKQTVQPLTTLLASLKNTKTYLHDLAASQVGRSFYLPANAATNQAYQNSLFTNISSDLSMTQLTVTLKSAPASAASRRTLQRLQAVTHDILLATPLAHAKILTTGVTQQQHYQHTLIATHALRWLTIGLIIGIVVLWFGLRSLTFSLLMTACLTGVTLTSWGWTQLILTRWLQTGPLSSSVLLGSLMLLTLHWLMITTATSYRQSWLRHLEPTQLQQHFYTSGRFVCPVTMIELTYLLPLLLTTAPTLKGLALMSLIGITISNLIVPLGFSGWTRWANEPPAIATLWQHFRPSSTNR
ncbi:hypothetical protein AWA2013_21250 [Lactiplantibacillus plantarum]|nr:hypothetical protein [Lactiplantibacillus plantarum]BEI50719.1 hypothetical protein AWA2013_21250 [Lactiplantibacillus plantarum]